MILQRCHPACADTIISIRIYLPISPRFSPTNFHRDASSALLQLVNQWLKCTYSRSHAFRYGSQNKNPDFCQESNSRPPHFFFFLFLSSHLTSSLPSCLWSQRIFPSLPGSRLTIFLSRCKFSTLTTRQPKVEFYLLTFPRFPLRKKEHKSYFGKNRTHDFRTSRCAAYLLDHSGDELFNINTIALLIL